MSHNEQSEILLEADAKFEAFAQAPRDKKPSENELIMFSDFFNHCVGENTSLERYAMPRLEGFYQLVKDNPRIQPLSEALKNMTTSYEVISKVLRHVESL